MYKIISYNGAKLYQSLDDGILIQVNMGKKLRISTYWYDTKKSKNKYHIKRKRMVYQLKSHGCALCGYNKCAAAMDFHHIGEKVFSLNTNLFCRHTNQEIADEIAKCILLCANCHREVHFND